MALQLIYLPLVSSDTHWSYNIRAPSPMLIRLIEGFTNFMQTILTKVVPDNLKACLRFVRRSNK